MRRNGAVGLPSPGTANLGGLAFVERQRHGLRTLSFDDTAVRRTYAALRHHIANAFLAFAATHRDAELELKFVEGVDSLGDGGADLPVRH